MKIIENTDDRLVLRAVPWVSYTMHGILGLGFLVGFIISATDGSSLPLTLGFAGCAAFVIRVCAFQLSVVTAQFDRPQNKVTVTVTRRNGKGRTVQTHALGDITGYDTGFERDGDAVSVMLQFADGTKAELPAAANGFVTTTGQVVALDETIENWVNR